MSTLLSTPRQVTIPPSYLDIGMGGHFERFGGVVKALGRPHHLVGYSYAWPEALCSFRAANSRTAGLRGILPGWLH